MLIIRPPNAARKAGPTSFRKPALTTRSGAYAATSLVSASSQSARLGWSATACTKVGMPAAAARSSPATAGRSEPTATTDDAVGRVAAGVDQRLQQGSGAGDEHHHPGRLAAYEVDGQRHGDHPIQQGRRPP